MVLSNDWIVGAIGGCPGWTAGGTGVGGPACATVGFVGAACDGSCPWTDVLTSKMATSAAVPVRAFMSGTPPKEFSFVANDCRNRVQTDSSWFRQLEAYSDPSQEIQIVSTQTLPKASLLETEASLGLSEAGTREIETWSRAGSR
jgi:hypothetical protein